MLFAKVFTVAEANALVPLVKEHVARLQAFAADARLLRAAIEQAETEAQALANDREANVAIVDERAKAAEIALDAIDTKIEAELSAMHLLGVTLKVLEPATVDVWARRGTTLVELCWREGESRFGHWHRSTEGFAGRRAIVDPSEFGTSALN